MRNAILLAALVLAAAVSSACSSQAAITRVPTLPPDAPSKVGEADIYCPTLDDQAQQHYNDAVELERQGRLEDAREHYEQAIELDPAYCDAMDNLGRLLRSQGRLDQAIYWYKQSIDVLPNNTVAHQNLAVAYRIQGRTAEAIAEYQLLARLDPDNPEAYYGLAQCYLDLDQPHKAVTQGKQAERLYARRSSPLLTDARHLLGIAYFELEDCRNALEYLEPIYLEMQGDPSVNYVLGLCHLLESQDRELAWRYLEEAQALGVDIPQEVLLELGK